MPYGKFSLTIMKYGNIHMPLLTESHITMIFLEQFTKYVASSLTVALRFLSNKGLLIH